MTTETANSPSGPSFRWLPWVLGAGIFLLYLSTLHPGMTSANTMLVSSLAGWNWRPTIYQPATALLTLPLLLLPKAWLPMALNLFTSACGALIVGWLVRAIAILPHDRTQAQREREFNPHAWLSIRHAWLPQVFGGLTCGLGLGLWQGATQGSPAIFDLLLFAYSVRCLLEYRVQERQSWLLRFALAYGLAISNNWIPVFFLPAFLVAIIWIKGLSFFNVGFLTRMIFCGLTGVSALWILPLIMHLAHPTHVPFWLAIQAVVGTYKGSLMSMTRGVAAVLFLCSIIPVTLCGFRWTSFFGDTSQLGSRLADGLFQLIKGMYLPFLLWIALDAPLSPRAMLPTIPFPMVYFLGALSIGYFSGFFLLTCGVKTQKVARGRQQVLPIVKLYNVMAVGAVWLLLVCGISLLVVRGWPVVQLNHQSAMQRYHALMEKTLPATGSVILCDDSVRAYRLEQILAKLGKASEYLVVDTSSLRTENPQPGFVLINPEYVRHLDRKHPEFKVIDSLTNQPTAIPDPSGLVRMMAKMSEKRAIYYAQPSFGFYFEAFYPISAGMFYQMKLMPRDPVQAPPITQQEIDAAEKFWEVVVAEELPRLKAALQPDPNTKSIRKLFEGLHLREEQDVEALEASSYYARGLDWWGVRLQRAGQLQAAAKRFQAALAIKPESVSAKVNLEANQMLQAGKKFVPKTQETILASFGEKFRSWDQVLAEDGPFDEPSFCSALGGLLTQSLLFHQAISELERTRELEPDNLNVRLLLAQEYGSYVMNFSNAVLRADDALALSPKDPFALFLKAGALIQMKLPEQAVPILGQIISAQPTNWLAFFNRAIANLSIGNLSEAARDYGVITNNVPKAFSAYFGLGEIAYRNKDTNAAIVNYKLYLTNELGQANPAEVKSVQARLKELAPVQK